MIITKSADPGRRKGERVRAERLSNTNTTLEAVWLQQHHSSSRSSHQHSCREQQDYYYYCYYYYYYHYYYFYYYYYYYYYYTNTNTALEAVWLQQHHSSSRSSHQHIRREQQDYYYYYHYYYYFRAMVFFVPGADFFDAVFLLVSYFIRGSSSNQNWRSKLDKIRFLVGFQKGRFGLRGTISSRISEGTLRLPGNLLLRLILHHFRHEIRWCFAVSAVFRKRCLAAGFLLFIEAAAAIEIGRSQNWTKLDF